MVKCYIVNVRYYGTNHLILYYDNLFYDWSSKILVNYCYEDIIGYIEIYNWLSLNNSTYSSFTFYRAKDKI